MPDRSDRTAGVGALLRPMIARHLRAVLRNVDRFRRTPGEDELHDIRTELRRTRTLIRATSAIAPDDRLDRVAADLKELGTMFGKARDHDVMAHTIETILHDHPEADTPAVRRLLKRLRAVIAKEYRTISTSLNRRAWVDRQEAELRALARELKRDHAETKNSRNMNAHVRRMIKKRMKRIHEDSVLAASDRSEDLHELRKTTRRLRYLHDVFSEYLGKRDRERCRRIRKAEKKLGKLHDLDVLLARLTDESDAGLGALRHSIEHERTSLKAAFRRKWSHVTIPRSSTQAAPRG